jgi:hypothetical protein
VIVRITSGEAKLGEQNLTIKNDFRIDGPLAYTLRKELVFRIPDLATEIRGDLSSGRPLNVLSPWFSCSPKSGVLDAGNGYTIDGAIYTDDHAGNRTAKTDQRAAV